MSFCVSQFIGRPVTAPCGKTAGHLRDVVVDVRAREYPPVLGLVVRTSAREAPVLVPACNVLELDASGVRLSCEDVPPGRVTWHAGDVLVRRDLVDRLAIDTRHARVGTVLDAELRRVDGQLSLVGADVGATGLRHRLAPHLLAPRTVGRLVDWHDVVPAASWSSRVLELRARLARLSALPPASIVRIVNALTNRQAGDVLAALEAERAAQTAAMLVPDRRIAILATMPAASVATILRALPAEVASHALGRLPARQVAELLMADAGLAISVRQPVVKRR